MAPAQWELTQCGRKQPPLSLRSWSFGHWVLHASSWIRLFSALPGSCLCSKRLLRNGEKKCSALGSVMMLCPGSVTAIPDHGIQKSVVPCQSKACFQPKVSSPILSRAGGTHILQNARGWSQPCCSPGTDGDRDTVPAQGALDDNSGLEMRLRPLIQGGRR